MLRRVALEAWVKMKEKTSWVAEAGFYLIYGPNIRLERGQLTDSSSQDVTTSVGICTLWKIN